MDASNGAPERAPKSVPSVRSVVFESRFRRSIRLEATRRALQGQWIRQAAVWLCSFSEILAVASVPGVHLITNPWFTMAALFLMFLLACWRAGSVLDVFFQPAHLLRPKNYSRFGLGESQSSCRTFYSLSMLLRVTCAAVLASRFLTYVYGQSDWHLCSAFWYPWAEYKSSELEKDLVLCRAFPDFSSWCPTILGFGQRCHDPVRWSTQLRSYAFNELGLECNSSQTADLAALASVSEDLYGFHCESLNGSEVECYPYPLPDFTLLQEDLIIYTDPVETSLEVCKSWPPVNVFYECQMFWDEVSECSRISQTPLRTALESVVSKFCELQRCKSTLPQWLKAPLNEEELFFFCQCQHCTPWHRSNECIVEVLDQAMRRAAGFQFLAEIEAHAFFSDPLFTLHFILVATCVGGPVLWLFASLLFCCCVGNPWAVPVDVKLQELVQMEETALQAELASQGTTEGYLNRLWILMAVGFCVADFVTDIRMVVLYLQTYHYSFALIQGLFVVRSLLEQLLRRGLLYFFQEFRVSMKANLWTDNLLAVVQSEKTGEATLAFILQIYSLFYMGEELLGYWTALISLLIGARGLTQGCYIHFDLAFIASENLPPIYEDDLPEAPEPSSVVPAPVRSVPTVPTLEMPPPLLVESLPKLDGEPKDLPEAPPPPADLQGEMPDLDEGIGENLRPTAVHPNVEVPGPTGPMVLGKGQNVILAL